MRQVAYSSSEFKRNIKFVISGGGYVGNATVSTLVRHFGIKSQNISVSDKYDPDRADPASTVAFASASFHIVCVPTPLETNRGDDPRYDITEVVDAIAFAKAYGFKGITIIRSTLAPRDLAMFGDRIIYWPEFLRQNNAVRDAENPQYIVMGGNLAPMFVTLIEPNTLNGIPINVFDSPGEAAMVKLGINAFLANKVIISSHMSKLALCHGFQWDDIAAAIQCDPRIGNSHMVQPCLSGDRNSITYKWGYGGACLPKDTEALGAELKAIGIDDNFATWATDQNKAYDKQRKDMESGEQTPPDFGGYDIF